VAGTLSQTQLKIGPRGRQISPLQLSAFFTKKYCTTCSLNVLITVNNVSNSTVLYSTGTVQCSLHWLPHVACRMFLGGKHAGSIFFSLLSLCESCNHASCQKEQSWPEYTFCTDEHCMQHTTIHIIRSIINSMHANKRREGVVVCLSLDSLSRLHAWSVVGGTIVGLSIGSREIATAGHTELH
jgi:hypothetical protein